MAGVNHEVFEFWSSICFAARSDSGQSSLELHYIMALFPNLYYCQSLSPTIKEIKIKKKNLTHLDHGYLTRCRQVGCRPTARLQQRLSVRL